MSPQSTLDPARVDRAIRNPVRGCWLLSALLGGTFMFLVNPAPSILALALCLGAVPMSYHVWMRAADSMVRELLSDHL